MSIIITEKFEEAINYMVNKHGHEYRKGTQIPYISHLLATATTIMEHGESEDEVIAALLHDAAEDAGGKTTLIEIENKFGPKVAEIVLACSDTLEKQKPEWKNRKTAYLEELNQVKNPSILLVSIADKLHNIKSILRDYKQIGEELWTRFNANRDEILCYYSSLLDIYKVKSKQIDPYLINELETKLEEINKLIDRNKTDASK